MATMTGSGLNPKRRATRRQLAYVTLNDFTKGIDARADKTSIQQGWAMMARNVTWFDRGAIYARRGVGPITWGRNRVAMAGVAQAPVAYHNFRRGSQSMENFLSEHIVVRDDRAVYVGTQFIAGVLSVPAPALDGAWHPMVDNASAAVERRGAPTFVEWDNYCYITLGRNETTDDEPMIRWDGGNAVALGTAWSEDIANPTGGNMPRARYGAALNNRFYVGFLLADSIETAKPNRVHFSHPDRPEDWRSEDWIDVGASGDEITALVPVRDMLLIFKRNATFALVGNSPDNFRVVQVVEGIGCDGHWDFGPTGAVVFWDPEIGVCQFDGSTVSTIFGALQPLIQDGSIRECKGIVVVADHVYAATDFYGVSAEVVSAGTGRTWDDFVNAGVTWDGLRRDGVRWDHATGDTRDMVWVRPASGGWTSWTFKHPASALHFGCLGKQRNSMPVAGDIPGTAQLVIGFDLDGGVLVVGDQYADGWDHFPDLSRIDAWYQTGWLHGGLPTAIKRWKSPRVIQGATHEGPLAVQVFYDFDPYDLRRELVVEHPQPEPVYTYAVDKPGTIGRAKAISLRISLPENSIDARQWSVEAITIPLYPKVLR